MMDGCADRGQGLARDGVFGELFDSDHLLAAWARRLQRRSDLRSMELVAAVSRGVPMCAPVWSHRRPPSGCGGTGTPALRHTAAPIVCSGPRASCTGQPLGLVQSGSDDRRHRRFGTLLVIDDHYVSLVHAVALSLRASRSGWPHRPLSSQHRLTSLECCRSPCSAPQRLILGRPHQGRPGPSPHWTPDA